MQRRYRQKKYHCGEYLEVAIYPVYTKAKGRGKRCKGGCRLPSLQVAIFTVPCYNITNESEEWL